MFQYTAHNQSLSMDPFSSTKATQTFAAGVTASPISKEFAISYAGSKNILVGIRATGVTVGSGITAKLQHSIVGTSGEEAWIDGNTAAITVAGWVYIRMNIENTTDQATMPLADVGRVVITTAAGAAVTINEVMVVQGQ